MQKELCQRVRLELAQGDCYLEYYTFQRSILNLPPQLNLVSYGVEVVKRSCVDGETLESKLISDVCCSVLRINEIVSILARNTVTPVSLRDVLETLLEEAEEGNGLLQPI